MNRTSNIYVAGHAGLVGSALMRALYQEGFYTITTRTFDELDLRDQQAVHAFFMRERPEYVFLAAARVGGIIANRDFPANFLYDNLMIQSNVIHAAHQAGVKKLLFLGSSCIYPRNCPQPIKEEYLLSGPLEPTNEPYALAKIAGLKLCQAFMRQHGCRFVVAMPTNLYGPGDNFDLKSSHVLPALLAKFIEARQEKKPHVVVGGSGRVLREFLHVDDLARALLMVMHRYEESEPLNIGSGFECSIAELAKLIQDIVGYEGEILFDSSIPDGTPRKLLDSRNIRTLGWQPAVNLREGIAHTMAWYTEHISKKQDVIGV